MDKIKISVLIIFYFFLGQLLVALDKDLFLENSENSAPKIDFFSVFFDFDGIEVDYSISNFDKNKKSYDYTKLINAEEMHINMLGLLELLGYNLFSIKDMPFYPNALISPDYRIAVVIRKISIFQGKEKPLFFSNREREFRVSLEADWVLYNVKNDLEIIMHTTKTTQSQDVIFSRISNYSEKKAFSELFYKCFYSSFQMFNVEYNLNKLFTSAHRSDFGLMAHFLSTKIIYQNEIWSLFSDDRKAQYINFMLQSARHKDYLFNEYEFIKSLKDNYLKTNKKDKVEIATASYSSVLAAKVDKDLSQAVFLQANNIAIIAGKPEGKEYLLELENSIVLEGKLLYYDEKYCLAFVEFPFFNKNYLEVGLLDNENNQEIFILSNLLDLYKWEARAKVGSLTQIDPYGKTLPNPKSFVLELSEDKKLDSSVLGLPVMDYFGNCVGIVSRLADGANPVIVNLFYLHTIFDMEKDKE